MIRSVDSTPAGDRIFLRGRLLHHLNIEKLAQDEPKALEARQLRDTYHYLGCEPGQPTYRYDILDAVQDPEGPFLCLPKIFDCRSDITIQALEESGWAEESEGALALVKGLSSPLAVFRFVDAVTSQSQQVRQVIAGVTANPAGEMVLLSDWKSLTSTNSALRNRLAMLPGGLQKR